MLFEETIRAIRFSISRSACSTRVYDTWDESLFYLFDVYQQNYISIIMTRPRKLFNIANETSSHGFETWFKRLKFMRVLMKPCDFRCFRLCKTCAATVRTREDWRLGNDHHIPRYTQTVVANRFFRVWSANNNVQPASGAFGWMTNEETSLNLVFRYMVKTVVRISSARRWDISVTKTKQTHKQ